MYVVDSSGMEIYVSDVRFYNLMGGGVGEVHRDGVQPNTIAGIEVYP